MSTHQLSHYRILRKLASGGMGDVYLAQDLRLNRYVALKILPPQYTWDADRLARFEQEARITSTVNHPNVVTIHDIEHDDGTHFIVTEYVDGETLRHRLDRQRLSLIEAVEIALGIAEALAAAHEYWIIHRDIKPDNVMIRTDGRVKVLDFGLAKLADGGLLGSGAAVRTAPGIVPGTLHYVAPERLRGEAADPRSDIFSLGALFYEMLAGRPPFSGDNFVEVADAILNSVPPPLSDSRDDLPPELPPIIDRLLAKPPDERYQTTREVVADLKELRAEIEFRQRQARGGVVGDR